MTNHTAILNLYKSLTGKTIHTPKSEPDARDIIGYQTSNVRAYFAQGNQFQRWK